jgi:exosortase E/protease (VPEID-CTERM system)
LVQRVLLLAAVLGSEALVASVYLDGAALLQKPGALTVLIGEWGAWALRFAIGFAAVFATFAWLKHKDPLLTLSGRAGGAPVSRPALAAHLAAVPLFAAFSALLYGAGPSAVPPDIIALGWIFAGVSVVVSAALAFLPLPLWIELRRVTGGLWILTSAAALGACVLGAYSRALWPPTTRLTFNLVQLILRPFFHDMFLRPDIMRLGTTHFAVTVTPECSGLEGAALLLIFGVLWLIVFRQDSRFPQSLLLLPAAILVLFLLNSVRIAVLIIIGQWSRDVALKGFHSQAGWIAFNFVAFGFSAAARRLPWFSKRAPELAAELRTTYNPAAAYLAPFLAILATRMISRAISGNFEWFYAGGFFAALAALWTMRRRYHEISWKFGWTAVIGGVFVFALWLALDRFTGAIPSGMPAQLAAAPPLVRYTWITFRVLAATLTVPIAEELAFRGFLHRRLVAAHFETVSFRTWTWLSIAVSSLAFGAMHGDRWLAGTVAGAVYGATAIRKGRLGEAAAAHAITNALLAAYILWRAQWQFW